MSCDCCARCSTLYPYGPCTENGMKEDIQTAVRWDHQDPMSGYRSVVYGSSHRNQVSCSRKIMCWWISVHDLNPYIFPNQNDFDVVHLLAFLSHANSLRLSVPTSDDTSALILSSGVSIMSRPYWLYVFLFATKFAGQTITACWSVMICPGDGTSDLLPMHTNVSVINSGLRVGGAAWESWASTSGSTCLKIWNPVVSSKLTILSTCKRFLVWYFVFTNNHLLKCVCIMFKHF